MFFILSAMTIMEIVDAHQGFKLVTDNITMSPSLGGYFHINKSFLSDIWMEYISSDLNIDTSIQHCHYKNMTIGSHTIFTFIQK